MTTRRGEPIETEQQTVQDILRPLAEARETIALDLVAEPKGAPLRVTTLLGRLDSRFDALRRPIVASDYVSGPGIQEVRIDGRPWTLDASLGAIMRAMGACGLVVTFLSASGLAQIDSMTYRSGPMRWHGDGATPEEGLARALVAAWRAEKEGR